MQHKNKAQIIIAVLVIYDCSTVIKWKEIHALFFQLQWNIWKLAYTSKYATYVLGLIFFYADCNQGFG